MLHDDSWLRDRLVYGFVRQDVGTIQIKLVVHDHILPQNRHILHTNLTTHINPKSSSHVTTSIYKSNTRLVTLSFTHPLANRGAPAHDAALQPGVRSNPRSLQHRAAFYPHPILHDHAGTDGHVRADGAVLPDLSRRVLHRKQTEWKRVL